MDRDKIQAQAPTETVSFDAEEIRRENICEVLKHVSKAHEERG